MVKSPDSFIPSMQGKSPEELRQWMKGRGPYGGHQTRKQEGNWITKGQYGYEAEIENNFGPEFFQFASVRMLANNGQLKVVSFGGGKLFSLVELYEKLKKVAEENELEAKIEIVDYSITTDLAKKVDEKDNQELVSLRNVMIESGIIRVHPGLLEVREVSDADAADIMVSRQGPFYHSDSMQGTREMIKKVVARLAPGGKAYFDTSLSECIDDDSGLDLERFKKFLGSDFKIVIKTKIDWQTRNWLQITRV